MEWRVPERFNFARDVVEPRTGPALTFLSAAGDRRDLGFAEVTARAAQWANRLAKRGVAPGDRVLVLVGKTLEWHPIMLALLKLGAVSIPCSEMLRHKDLAFRVEHSGARLVVADRQAEGEVEGLGAELVFTDAAGLDDEAQSAPTVDTAAGDLAFILYTSGTTKDPKGVVHTHAYCYAKRMQAERWLAARPGDHVWCTAATGWAKSIWNVLLGPWSAGASIVLHEGAFEPEERFRLLSELGVSVLCQAPTEYRLMAKLDGLDRFELAGLRHMVSAGEPLNPEVIKAFRDAFGLTIHDGYGQTENTLLVGNLPGAEIRPGSMGLPSPGHEIAVIDEGGHVVDDGAEGDIALAGRPPSLFREYYRAPEETAAVFRGEWYVTGDRATRDERRLPLVHRPRRRRHQLRRVPDRPVRGRERAAGASGRGRERGRRQARSGSRPDREGIRRAPPGRDRIERARHGAAGALQARDGAVQVPAGDRVRRRAAEDAERKDPPRRAAAARGAACRARFRAEFVTILRGTLR